ncbi:hypothetical protein [Cognatilysobacter tabacisoli]|uniref:hypothetical protein n=1 Tax=Cognatilysobacter tabacisoli TaxID=2315424 RepID=UPI0018C8B0C6|nr:hypothetical protein [Lysobacter tabacisoli]
MTPSLRAPKFAILKSCTECHRCQARITVSALMVPSYEECEEGEWSEVGDSALLMYVEAMDEVARSAWLSSAPGIRAVESDTAGFVYFGNVCECGELQGDWFLGKPGGPFFPQNSTDLEAIAVEWIEAPLSARASASRSSWTDDLIARSAA